MKVWGPAVIFFVFGRPSLALAGQATLDALSPSWLIIFTALVALMPLAIGLLTSYMKISIVFGMLRSAFGTQQTPSNLVIMVLALALTGYTMGPVIDQTWQAAQHIDSAKVSRTPSLDSFKAAAPLLEPWLAFIKRHAGKREVKALSVMQPPEGRESALLSAGRESPPAEESLRVLLPAFLLTELKEGFAMAFVLLLPFLVVDMIVANVLVGMGMYMVSPVLVSLPLKLILFVVADGWLLMARGLVNSYQG